MVLTFSLLPIVPLSGQNSRCIQKSAMDDGVQKTVTWCFSNDTLVSCETRWQRDDRVLKNEKIRLSGGRIISWTDIDGDHLLSFECSDVEKALIRYTSELLPCESPAK